MSDLDIARIVRGVLDIDEDDWDICARQFGKEYAGACQLVLRPPTPS